MSFIHTRLRDKKDDDIQAWYDAQKDKSEAVREAIRVKMRLDAEGSTQETVKGAVTSAAGAELPKLTEAVTSAADAELARLREAVIAAASEQLERLPGVVAAAVHDALASYRLAPTEQDDVDANEQARARAQAILEAGLAKLPLEED